MPRNFISRLFKSDILNTRYSAISGTFKAVPNIKGRRGLFGFFRKPNLAPQVDIIGVRRKRNRQFEATELNQPLTAPQDILRASRAFRGNKPRRLGAHTLGGAGRALFAQARILHFILFGEDNTVKAFPTDRKQQRKVVASLAKAVAKRPRKQKRRRKQAEAEIEKLRRKLAKEKARRKKLSRQEIISGLRRNAPERNALRNQQQDIDRFIFVDSDPGRQPQPIQRPQSNEFGTFGKQVGRAQAYVLSQVLFKLSNAILKNLRDNCPVVTGRLKRSIHAEGQPDIRNGPNLIGGRHNIGDLSNLDGEIFIGGDTGYMPYVKTYHQAVKNAADFGNAMLQKAPSFKIQYRFTYSDGRKAVVSSRPYNPSKLIDIQYNDVAIQISYPTILNGYFGRGMFRNARQ